MVATLVPKSSPTVDSKSIVDGWEPGKNPKIDYSGQFEFGGPWGVGAMIVGFPLLMYYMWIGATFYGGHLPLPKSDQSFSAFVEHLYRLVYEHAFPSLQAWTIYWSFFLTEAAFYCFLPGVEGYGKPLDHEGGKQLKYHCSAVWSFYITIMLAAVLHVTGIFPLYTIIDEFGPIMSVAILSGFLVAFAAYTSAWARGTQHRMSEYFVYDFFMGSELNPRVGTLDFKMFFMVRIPWFILFGLSCATAAKQYNLYGYVSAEVMFLVGAHFLYANACAKGEESILTTWDIHREKWGFMLIFWNLAGVPLSYSHCTLYFANHLDTVSEWFLPSLRLLTLTLLFTSYLFVYWVWDTAGSQKNRFRAQESGKYIPRDTFPQLPWQKIQNPRTLKAASGETILIDGWMKYARKLHYTCDIFFALTWGAITGFDSPFPWFYPVFFTAMILHRARRDIHRCREKYGQTWMEYEKMVPWVFIPYII